VPESIHKSNSRAKIKELDVAMFDSYYDYFLAIHMNPKVARLHSIGFVIGIMILPIFFYSLEWQWPLLFTLTFWGLGFISHYIYDGHFTKTSFEAPWKTFIYASMVNYFYLTKQLPAKRKNIIQKYPFLNTFYEGY
jgi:hypothetical protein